MNWQPIATAPTDGTEILLCLWDANIMIVAFYDHENQSHPWQTLDGISYHKEAPHHWMALPEPPLTGGCPHCGYRHPPDGMCL